MLLKYLHLNFLILTSGVEIDCNLWSSERSFNATSTASWLMLVCPRSSHHHSLALATEIRHERCTNTAKEPLPSLEGCEPDRQHLQRPQKHGNQPPAPPFPKGLWTARSRSTKRFGEGENTRGDPGSGRPS